MSNSHANKSAGNYSSNYQTAPVTINTGNLITNSSSSGYAFSIGAGELSVTLEAIPTSPDLPPISVIGHDGDRMVKMILQPEQSISGYESVQIMMMLRACSSSEFCPLAFVKKNNLERHFKFV